MCGIKAKLSLSGGGCGGAMKGLGALAKLGAAVGLARAGMAGAMAGAMAAGMGGGFGGGGGLCGAGGGGITVSSISIKS